MLIKSLNPDLIILSEVKPKNNRFNISASEFKLDHYSSLSNLQCSNGRGLLIYVKDCYTFSQVSTNIPFSEHMLVQLVLNSKTINILVIYRSPNSSEVNNNELISLINNTYHLNSDELIILGDFNYPSINWNTLSTDKHPHSAEYSILKCVLDNSLLQYVTSPTRQRGSDRPNILDLVFAKRDVISNLSIISPIGKSDHASITFDINISSYKQSSSTKKLNFFKADYISICSHIRKIDWSPLLKSSDIDYAWNYFISKIYPLIDKFVPLHCDSKHQINLSSSEILLIKSKHRLWTRYMENQTPENRLKYTRARNKVKNLARRKRNDFENSLACNSKKNPKAIWKYINSKSKNSSSITCITSEDGTKLYGDQEIAETFNKFFASVYQKEPLGLPTIPQESDKTLAHITISEAEVLHQLKEININKPPGPDNIHPKFLMETSNLISKPLTHLFNLSLKSGSLPKDWKTSKVTPIFKSGSKSCTNNYRPISVNSNVCKILEKILRDALMSHLMNNNLLSVEQHGFVPKKSTCLQLLLYMDRLTEAFENNSSLISVYFDFRKAFDTVPHKRLIHKLKTVGITGHLRSWLENYLENRFHYVQVGHSKSTLVKQTSGIPQGTILGPILFLIYVNDLPKCINATSLLFADDLKIFSDNINLNLQTEINKLSDWSENWLLKFNPLKCKYMSYGNEMVLPLHINNSPIENTNQQKDLGIIFDSKLDFNQHIHEKVSKANQILGIVRRSFKFLNYSSFLKLYKALVRNHLEYGVVIWHPYKMKHIDLIESVQRRATRYLPGLKTLPYEQRLKILKLPTLRYRRVRGDMIEVYKILNGYYNVDPKLLISLKTSLEIRLTSRNHPLTIFQEVCTKNTRKNFFSNRVTKYWNNLPSHVIFSPSLNSFKNRLDEHWDKIPFKYDYKGSQYIDY